ncbi:MAG: tetratricopeptide repeat protein [Bacteroidota bacterium]
MMKIQRILGILLVITMLASCSTMQLSNQGEAAYEQGDYETALAALEEIISLRENNGKSAEPEVYYRAGMAAHQLGQQEKAAQHLSYADYLGYRTPELYITLVGIYENIDNISKEITALQNYREHYPQGDRMDEMTARLFHAYVETENWQWAADLWPELEAKAQNNIALLTGYLQVNEALKKSEAADKVARQILTQDSDNKRALAWMGKSYFNRAEEMYVSEMKAYKHNRTTRQYNRLLKKLDIVYPNFRKARDYFLKLYKQDPQPEYAKYLARIYTRLDQKKKAAYYERRAE